MSAAMKASQARNDHWGLAAKSCVEALGGLPEGANTGFVYVTEALGDDLPSIVTFLRETTAVADWLGGVGGGVFGPLGESHDGRAMALMVGRLPAGAVHPFDSFAAGDEGPFLQRHGGWLAGRAGVTGLVHGDPTDGAVAEAVAELSEAANAFLFGGLTAVRATAAQVAGRMAAGTLSGALFGAEVALATGLTQGCVPIGGNHLVTGAVEGVIMTLDGRPALEVMRQEIGEPMARDLAKIAGTIHIARPIPGSDTHDYLVRGLQGIDPRHGWLAVGDSFDEGDRILFVRRDAQAAETDMRRMLKGLARRLDGRAIAGGIYVSCVARGPSMFGAEGRELDMIRDALGEFPLVGFSAGGEICHDRLYAYTGVLALFLK